MRGKSGTITITFILTIFMMLAVLAPVCHSSNEEVEITGNPPGWTDEINLSNNITRDDNPSIVAYQNNVYTVWRNMWGGDSRIFYRNSSDGGQTWSARRQLSTALDGQLPDIAVNNTHLHVVYKDIIGASDYEILYCNSTDGGTTWSSPKMISEDDGFESSGPFMTVNNSNVHVIWTDTRFGLLQSEVYYKRSTDGGITWDDGQGNPNLDRRITHDLSDAFAAGIGINNSNIHVLFGDNRDGSFDLYYTRSTDNGVTWDDGLGTIDEERKLTSNTTNHAWSDIAVNGSTIHVAWADQVWPGPYYYIYYRNSTDNGATWSPIQMLVNSGTANSPLLEVIGNDVHMTWNEWRGAAAEIYYMNSTDGGVSWSAEQQLTLDDGVSSGLGIIKISGVYKHLIFSDDREGNDEIYYKRQPNFPPDPTYNITLNEGWNLISTPLIQRDESIDKVLENITGKWDYIQAYDSINGTWLSNATFKPDQLNDLKSLNHKMAFWINITEPGGTVLTVSGPIPDSTSINLYAGWNLVGYPSLTTETVANALWGTGADKVEKFDALAPYRISEVGPTYVMKPGEGYWIHVPADTVWIINW
jgi:hypothetical protein